MDYCAFGNILEVDQDNNFSINTKYIKDKNSSIYSDEELKDILRDIVLGLDYCNYNWLSTC